MDHWRRRLKQIRNQHDYLRQIGDKLTASEATLFRLVKSASPTEVQEFLQSHPHLDTNKVNESCHTILQEAVCRRDPAMVEVLLGNGSDVNPALELAAQIGAHEVLDVLMTARNTDSENEVAPDDGTEDNAENDYSIISFNIPVDETINEGLSDGGHDETSLYLQLKTDEVNCTGDSINGQAEPLREYVDCCVSPKKKRKGFSLRLLPRIPSCIPSDSSARESSPDSSFSKKRVFGRTKSCPDQSGAHSYPKKQCNIEKIANLLPAEKVRRKSLSSQPLVMAASADDYEGTALLIKMGCQIREPHAPKCMCLVCKNVRSDHHDLLHDAYNRLMKYRALTSASYVILTSPDPILTALERSDRLAVLAALYPENKHEFEELSRKSSSLAVELLTNCISEKEVVLLLTRESGLRDKGIFTYGRLQLAVGLEQKEFVTNSTCQHALYSLWLGPTKNWLKWCIKRKMIHVIFHFVLYPVICAAYVLVTVFPSTAAKTHAFTEFQPEREFPKKSLLTRCCEDPVSTLTNKALVPLNRFIYAASSYCCFLALLLYVIVQQREEEIHPEIGLCWYHWLLCTWVLAHVYKVAQDLYTGRFLSYWSSWWTLFELIMMLLFMIASCCFIAARIEAVHQKTWRLALVAEGLFPIATTLSFMRTLQWMHLSQNLGPVIISFSRMTVVIGRLFVVFLIVLLSFSTGLYAVYQNFRPVDDSANEDSEESKGLFMSYSRTAQALFWAIFGHGEAEYAGVPKGYAWHMTASNTSDSFLSDPNESFPVVVGYTLWGLFHVAFVIVLLNMLIAVMTNCFQVIQDNFDVEWKFARTKLWMYYLEDHNAVPPPFNLLLPLTCVVAAVACRLKNVLKPSKPSIKCYSDTITVTDGTQIEMPVKRRKATRCLMSDKARKDVNDQYTKTMTLLVERLVQKRYLKDVLKGNE